MNDPPFVSYIEGAGNYTYPVFWSEVKAMKRFIKNSMMAK